MSHVDNIKLYLVAIAARLLLGIALISSAELSKFPAVFSVLGYITLFAVAVLIAIGHSRFKRLINWAASYTANFARPCGLLVLPVGLWLIYAVT